jgi:hypothetical protein
MKAITVSKQQLIEVIESVSSNFGNSFIVIAVDNEGFVYSAEQVDSCDHVIMTIAGLGDYVDDAQIYPANEGYDSLGVATYIVEQEDFIKTSFEYDDEEHVGIKIVDLSDLLVHSTEVIDNCEYEDEDGNYQPSEISVLIGFDVAGESYNIDFQTTTTHDVGAYSSRLAAYDGDDNYSLIVEALGEHNARQVLKAVVEKTNAESMRAEYVSNNYTVSTEEFGGIDANSEINKATKK